MVYDSPAEIYWPRQWLNFKELTSGSIKEIEGVKQLSRLLVDLFHTEYLVPNAWFVGLEKLPKTPDLVAILLD